MQPACCGARLKAASCSVHWGSLCVGLVFPSAEASAPACQAPSVAATAHTQPPLEVCGVVRLHSGCVAGCKPQPPLQWLCGAQSFRWGLGCLQVGVVLVKACAAASTAAVGECGVYMMAGKGESHTVACLLGGGGSSGSSSTTQIQSRGKEGGEGGGDIEGEWGGGGDIAKYSQASKVTHHARVNCNTLHITRQVTPRLYTFAVTTLTKAGMTLAETLG